MIREAYRPSEAEIGEATRASGGRGGEQPGVFRFRGRMVDGPVLAHARSVLARASRAGGPESRAE